MFFKRIVMVLHRVCIIYLTRKILFFAIIKINRIKEADAMKYVCDVCGWIYDEEVGDEDQGIAPGTKFEDLPEDFLCPLCSVGKELFSEVVE